MRRECEYQYHGAQPLGANSLVLLYFCGFIAGPNAVRYARNLKTARAMGISTPSAASGRKQRHHGEGGRQRKPFKLWRRVGDLMTKNCTVIRYNKKLQETDAPVVQMLERFRHINLSDRSQWANTSVVFARQLYNMLQLARSSPQVRGMRDESRGPLQAGFPERDDKNWLRPRRRHSRRTRTSRSLT